MVLRFPCLGLLVVVLSAQSAFASFIANGDFSTSGVAPDTFAAWTTFSIYDPAEDGGGFAVFSENGMSGIQLEQLFMLPAGAQTISFEFKLGTVADTTGTSSPPDSFQATLYDLSFNSFFSTGGDPVSFPAFYSIDNTGPEFFDNTFVSTIDLAGGWRRVTLNVSTLMPQELLLEFLLNGGSDGQMTTVSLDNVSGTASVAVVPEPSSVWMFGSGVIAILFYGIHQVRRSRCVSNLGEYVRL